MTKFDPRNSRIYQNTPVNALVEGIYEQNMPISEIQKHGDFGLGTFNDLDGEMVLLDGQIYRVDSNGNVSLMSAQTLTPFACVTFFHPMSTETSQGKLAYGDFLSWLKMLMPSANLFYAFRIEGEFDQVKTRSIPKQENYRPLVEATKEQPEFHFKDVTGTLVGFFTPAFMASVNVPGLHLHFLTQDRQRGGHLLECQVKRVKAEIQFIYTLELSLPLNLDYLTWDFQRDIQGDLDKAEK
ncbi:MAG TPA: acetolactate decarboxylase [Anaerolineales bacterium]|nr:acetolactate decarboxylase [Anaerolineales bacterium]